MGWLVHTPSIYRIRWKFLEDVVSLEHCVEDAYNTLVTIQQAHYPNSLRLKVHKRVNALLTNYSELEINRKRTAELYEMWAHQLAVLPEAAPLLHFKHLPYEQAHSLSFAAQAHRLLKHFDHADRLLDDAEALMLIPPPVEENETIEVLSLNDLKLGLKVQRAWLRNDQGENEISHKMIRAVWREVHRDDWICANLLASLLAIEHQQDLLLKPWPPSPDIPIYADPDNPDLSLPAEWFGDEEPLELRNRFEFRLRQLMSITSPVKHPSLRLLHVHAITAWRRRSKFAETCMQFAALRTGVQIFAVRICQEHSRKLAQNRSLLF